MNADTYPERKVTRGAWPHEGAGERARDPGWVFCPQPRALSPTDLLAGGQRPALCQGPSPLKPAVRASSLTLTPGVTPGPVSSGLVRKFHATLCLHGLKLGQRLSSRQREGNACVNHTHSRVHALSWTPRSHCSKVAHKVPPATYC